VQDDPQVRLVKKACSIFGFRLTGRLLALYKRMGG